jgi:hypothetical protein
MEMIFKFFSKCAQMKNYSRNIFLNFFYIFPEILNLEPEEKQGHCNINLDKIMIYSTSVGKKHKLEQ